jgi:drug/metabolite transporter (DMT)-like permease
LVTIRFITGFVVVSTLFRQQFKPANLFTNPRLIARGVIGAISTVGFYQAIIYIGAGRATFINNTYVVWAGLFAVWFLGEKLKPRLMMSCVATLIGLALLTKVLSTGMKPGVYDAIALFTAFGSASVTVLIRSPHNTEHTSTIFGSQCLYGTIICGIPAVLSGSGIPTGYWPELIGASLLATSSQLFMTRAYRELPVGKGVLFQTLVPVGVTIGGVILFQENFSGSDIVGAILIIAATAWAAKQK